MNGWFCAIKTFGKLYMDSLDIIGIIVSISAIVIVFSF
jgi:hypothetical protein